jgi:hypothetical protein
MRLLRHPARLVLLTGLLLLPPADAGAQQTATPPGSAPTSEQAPQPVPPQAFRSPEDGFAAFAAAMRAHDERALLRILGTAGRRLVRSGDPVADREVRERFRAAYDEQAEIRRPAPDRAVLQLGADGWPLPIPMLRRDGNWRFDARQGEQALIDRRVGRNELDTIETLRAIAEAQDEYARTTGRAGALLSYARRFFSTPGQRDGLFWPTAENEPPSPLGPLLAAASVGGYARPQPGDAPQPLRGYYFRILEGQGPAAPGGAFDYVVNGRMIGGFAVLAVPARYRSTGIKTFMISHHGDVWEADLGPETERRARRIDRFDPGPGWVRVSP